MAGKLRLAMLWLLCIVTRVCCQLTVHKKVRVYEGQNVTLQCMSLGNDLKLGRTSRIFWHIQGMTPEEYLNRRFWSKMGVVTIRSNIGFADRLEVLGQQLVIKDVRVSDAGNYTCSSEETTQLVVCEADDVNITPRMDIMPRMIALGVFLLIIVAMAIITCLSVLRIRRKAFKIKYSVDSNSSNYVSVG
ncbi:uncharacterized protein LOC144057374 isoform X2 [Vanacampus margaritifer]